MENNIDFDIPVPKDLANRGNALKITIDIGLSAARITGILESAQLREQTVIPGSMIQLSKEIEELAARLNALLKREE